jgi:Lamin Tail Domain
VRPRLVLVGVLVLAMLAIPATASGAIRIARIRYNPPGADSGSNTHLNHEFVVIRNTGDRRVILTGWKLVERREGRVFTFPRFRLPGHHTVTIYTGTDTDRRYVLFWNRDDYVWHNGRDTATLRDDNGDRIDRCSYVVDPDVKQWLGHSADC